MNLPLRTPLGPFARHAARRLARGLAGAMPLLLILGLFVSSLALAQAPAPVEPPELLKKIDPEYPKALQERGLSGAVVVELDLDVQGKPTKVTVVESAGPEFDEAAIVAARQLEFTPARQGGKPIAVRIRYRFAFSPQMIAQRRGPAGSSGRYDRRDVESVPSGLVSLQGQVSERGTGRPVGAAPVTLPALSMDTMTDGDGRFRFGPIKPGTWELYLPGTDHKPWRQKVTIKAGETTSVRIKAERLSYTLYRATAEAPPEPGETARRSIGVEEIQKVPGTQGDAFKVVQNLPGVARPVAASGFLVVRGSAPQDTLITVEGVHIPLIYHFGGVYSILNTDLLESIDFFPGGYPSRHGRQTGGLINARLAAPRDLDRWTGYVEANVYHAGFMVKGPLGKDTQIAVAARRSYIDAFLGLEPIAKLLPLTLAPRYWDYQVKLDHRVSDRTTLTGFVFGSDDSLTAVLKDPPAAFPQAHGDIETRTSFHTLLGTLKHRGDGWTSSTTVAGTFGIANASFADLFRFDLINREYTLRQDFTAGEGPVQLRSGLDILCNPFDIEVYAPKMGSTGERGTGGGGTGTVGNQIAAKQSGLLVSPSAYFDAVFKLHPDLEVVPGLRLDLFRGISGGEALTPRMNLRWAVAPAWTVKGSSGMNVQRPQPQEVSDRFGNPALLPFRSYETAAGFEWKTTSAVDLDFQVFRKDLRDLVIYPKSAVPQPPVNGGRGSITGAEILLRHRPVGNFFGWIAYTLQRAERQDTPADPVRLFGWDQTHILTMLGSYKLPDNWEVGARFRFVTGNPTTPLATAVYNEQTDTYTRVPSPAVLSARLPAFHQLDIRVDKKFVFDSFLLNLYLDVQNVYNHGNPENIQYNYDATQSTYATGLPIIPSLGIRGEF